MHTFSLSNGIIEVWKGGDIMAKTNNFVRVNISIDKDLLRRADEWAIHNYLSRSGLISVALSAYLNAQQMGQAMAELTALVSKLVAEGGTAEDFERLQKIQDMVNLIQGKD